MRDTLTAAVLAAAAVAPPALGQDPVPLYPENYTVVLENDRVRVVDFRLRKDATENAHSHPAHVLYVIAPFKVRFTFPDGRTGIREVKAGDILFSEAVTHATENIGGTDAHGILVELKTSPGMGRASGTSAGMVDDDLLTAVTFITGLEGREEELQRELLALEAPTRAEPGNITYDLYQSTEAKNRFMRFEVWRNAQALEDHKATPHLRASFQKRQEQGWTTQITTWKRVRP
jgi:quinol monooxygenase YgiN/quercetin dioxygenase-like cupin family protein